MTLVPRIAAGALVLAAASAVVAHPPPRAERGDGVRRIERRLDGTLRDVINRGAKLYNGGDVCGCVRVYEGALATLGPMLEHRPELAKGVRDALDQAGEEQSCIRRAFQLRRVLDRVRHVLNPHDDDGGKRMEELPEPSVDKKAENKRSREDMRRRLEEEQRRLEEARRRLEENEKRVEEMRRKIEERRRMIEEARKKLEKEREKSKGD